MNIVVTSKQITQHTMHDTLAIAILDTVLHCFLYLCCTSCSEAAFIKEAYLICINGVHLHCNKWLHNRTNLSQLASYHSACQPLCVAIPQLAITILA